MNDKRYARVNILDKEGNVKFQIKDMRFKGTDDEGATFSVQENLSDGFCFVVPLNGDIAFTNERPRVCPILHRYIEPPDNPTGEYVESRLTGPPN